MTALAPGRGRGRSAGGAGGAGDAGEAYGYPLRGGETPSPVPTPVAISTTVHSMGRSRGRTGSGLALPGLPRNRRQHHSWHGFPPDIASTAPAPGWGRGRSAGGAGGVGGCRRAAYEYPTCTKAGRGAGEAYGYPTCTKREQDEGTEGGAVCVKAGLEQVTARPLRSRAAAAWGLERVPLPLTQRTAYAC
jgi:hypothetical protein